jgi:phospholipid/cholesterol/gamma-HCH transport system substrate-binding protein
MRRSISVAVAVMLVAVVVAAVVVWRLDRPHRSLVAHFTSTVGVHVGSDLRVLGVRVGEVTAVTPEGQTVRVDLRYDTTYDFPVDVQAIVVSPSIVSDRYVQLTPAYSGGPTLADGADLPVSRTAVPLEVDDVYRSLDQLNRALGPSGANANGALADLVATARKNLEGSGGQLNETISGLSQALSTVARGRADLFATVTNLSDFTTALAQSDAQVRLFNQRLAAVGEQLAAERDDLAAALRSLGTALADVKVFVRDNRDALVSNVAALADITGILVRQQQALMTVLDVAPLALSNLNLVYNVRSGTLDTRDNALGPYDPASYVCSLMVNVIPAQQIPASCMDLAKLLAARGLPLTNELRKLIGLAPVAAGSGGTAAGTTPSGGAVPGSGGAVPGVLDATDRTLGGILRGGK